MQKTEKNRHYVSAQVTHIGRVRERNEDACIALTESGFWLVADGMGGAAGGDVASAVVVGHMTEQIAQGRPLEKALYSTHQAVIRAAREGVCRNGLHRGGPQIGRPRL